MLSSNDVREVKFSKAMGGYKQEEVDNFLDMVEDDYCQYEAYITNAQKKIEELTAEVEEYKKSQASLQNILVGAQQLADKTVDEAKHQAEAILNEAKEAADSATAQAREMLETFDAQFSERRANAEKKLEEELEILNQKKLATQAATEETVKRQQALFDKTKIEVAAFKKDITELYKKHLELIAQIPDCVTMDAQRAADAVALEIEKSADVSEQVKPDETPEEQHSKTTDIFSDTSESNKNKGGFEVILSESESTDDDVDTQLGFENNFFSANNQ